MRPCSRQCLTAQIARAVAPQRISHGAWLVDSRFLTSRESGPFSPVARTWGERKQPIIGPTALDSNEYHTSDGYARPFLRPFRRLDVAIPLWFFEGNMDGDLRFDTERFLHRCLRCLTAAPLSGGVDPTGTHPAVARFGPDGPSVGRQTCWPFQLSVGQRGKHPEP